MSKYGKRSNEVKSQLHFILQYTLDEAIIKPPYDFGLHSGHRPTKLQNEYYQQGRTTPGKIITWVNGITEIGYHNFFPSLAFDFHCSIKGNTWDVEKKEVDGDPAYLHEIGEHILEIALQNFGIKLVWGRYWEDPDAPHIQTPRIFKTEALKQKLY